MYSNVLFTQATTYILRAFHSANIGITNATTSNVNSTCIVLALVAGRQDCQPALSRRLDATNVSQQYQVSNSACHDCKYDLRDAC